MAHSQTPAEAQLQSMRMLQRSLANTKKLVDPNGPDFQNVSQGLDQVTTRIAELQTQVEQELKQSWQDQLTHYLALKTQLQATLEVLGNGADTLGLRQTMIRVDASIAELQSVLPPPPAPTPPTPTPPAS